MFSAKSQDQMIHQTSLLYLQDSSVLENSAVVVDVISLDNDQVGNNTNLSPFYAKGGGQKADVGTIGRDYDIFHVTDVWKDQSLVIHVGSFSTNPFNVGDKVNMKVEASIRMLHTQLHTGGELICSAMKRLGYNWEVIGAIHYPERCSIDYNVILSSAERENLWYILQREIESMITIGNEIKICTYTEPGLVVVACGYYPQYVADNEPIRVVTVWDGIVGRPCMGTHLTNINQLWPIVITGVKTKKGVTTIKYTIN